MLSCVCMLLLAASALGHMDEVSLDAQWEQWKITHSKEYNGLVSACSCVLYFKGFKHKVTKCYTTQNRNRESLKDKGGFREKY